MHPKNLRISMENLKQAGIEPKKGINIVLQDEGRLVNAKIISVEQEHILVRITA